MALPSGFRIGSYEIVGLLGVGGMGEVYRARDTKLGRDVAVKSLPDLFASDPERVARFEREAQVLASLSHSNIAGIYGLEQLDNHRFLILEFIEGHSLANRLAAGALPFDDALAIARQLLDALEAAHDKGIVHRDIKPANMMITADGVVKVLDFGLARVVESNPTSNTSNSPTLTFAATQVGVILGTAAYMSPEQAKGRVADKRSDVWAFACVFYEMLTGKRVFEGEDVSDTLAAVLRADPDWSALPADVPPGVRTVLKRCLERDRKARIPEISTVRFLLQDAATQPGAPVAAAPPAVRPRMSSLRIVTAAIAGVALVAAGAAVAWRLKPSPRQSVIRFPIIIPPKETLTNPGRRLIAISPDGTEFVYNAERRLNLRLLSQIDAKPVAGTEVFDGILDPAFSPDGQSLAFWAAGDRTLKRIAVAGGPAVTICATDTPLGIDWSAEGIAVALGSKGILRVPPDNGAPSVVVTMKGDEVAQGPQLLPGGASVLFTLATGISPDRWDKAQIVVQSLKTGQRRTIVQGGSDARYLPRTGHLVYALSGSLYAVRFDAERAEAKGTPVPIVEGIRRSTSASTGVAQYSISDTGTLMYIPGPATGSGAASELALSDRKGELERLKLAAAGFETPRVSPDGQRVAFGLGDAIWTYNLSGTAGMQRLTFGGKNRFPIWSADGRHIAFQSDREGDLAVFWQPADGSGTAERLTKAEQSEAHVPLSWAPKGEDRFLFDVIKGGDVSLATYSLRDRKVTPFAQVRSSTPTGAVFSPDARWVAYTQTEQGRATVVVQPDPPTGARYQLFAKAGDVPHEVTWSADGKEMFYNPRPGGFEAVSVTTQPAFAFGNPVPVPRAFILGPPASQRAYDVVSSSGKFLGLVAPGQSDSPGSSTPILVVVNWFEELRARVK